MRQFSYQGAFLAGIALVFGLNAVRYPVGTLERPGPGLFPILVSAALLLLSVVVAAGSRGPGPSAAATGLRWRNIGTLLLALAGFVLLTRLVDMAAGIAVLVLTAGMAARRPSLRRGAILALALIVIALGFERLLGLRLRVF